MEGIDGLLGVRGRDNLKAATRHKVRTGVLVSKQDGKFQADKHQNQTFLARVQRDELVVDIPAGLLH